MTDESTAAALFAAIADGQPDAVRQALAAGAPVEARDEDDWSPLDRAAGNGDAALVRVLLEHGADPTAVGREQRTPYEIALAAGHLAAARLLRDAEEQADPASRERHEWRPYCRAYRISQLRHFSGWREPAPDAGLGPDDIVYVHDDLTVTRGVWPGEDEVFADQSNAWAEFCRHTLAFRVPDDFDLVPPARPQGT